MLLRDISMNRPVEPAMQTVQLITTQCMHCRQQLSHQAHETHFEPSLGLVQQSHNIQVLPSHTLAILPPFANPQTLAAPDGSIVFLEPEPYLHDAQDVVNHTADTAVEGSKLLKQNQKHAAATRGQPTDMPQPNFGPVKRSALVIALTSSADRSEAWHAHLVIDMPLAFLWCGAIQTSS